MQDKDSKQDQKNRSPYLGRTFEGTKQSTII